MKYGKVFDVMLHMKTIFFTLFFSIAAIYLSLCGCDRSGRSYIYLKPHLAVYDTVNRTELAANGETQFNNTIFSVIIPVEEYTEAAILPLVSKAYATSVRDPGIHSLEKIKSIRILTLRDYNALHQAGSDITDSCIFLARAYRPWDSAYSVQGLHTSVNSLIDYLNNSDRYLYGYNSYYSNAAISFSFLLRQPPALPGQQQFVIKFETEEGAQFSDTSVLFNLKP